MADARALLRAHRADNRIKHPHATYSDAGKLLCRLCHETVKSESLWDGHLRGANHRRNVAATVQARTQPTPGERVNDNDEGEGRNTTTTTTTNTNKRKLDDLDTPMSDAADADEHADPDPYAPNKKRSKTDREGGDGADQAGATTTAAPKEKTQTPPLLGRRTSGTPVHGVEIAIPSRPATPHAGSTNSSTSTPLAVPGRSPLIGVDGGGGTSTPNSFPSVTSSTSNPNNNTSSSNGPNATSTTTAQQQKQQEEEEKALAAIPRSNPVDEAEWAAFEAEIAAADTAENPAPPPAFHEEATISAPAMTAEQAAARSREEEDERRKALQDAALADEREDAAARLEAEFDDMREFEDRVRRLKERREELRRGSAAAAGKGRGEGNPEAMAAVVAGDEKGGRDEAEAGSSREKDKGKGREERGGGDDEDEDEDDDDDDDEDEYDVFRFRG